MKRKIFLMLLIGIFLISCENKPKYPVIGKPSTETPVNKETAKSISLGLSESSKKSAFYNLVILQDEYMNKDPYNTQKQQDAYRIIANKYGISENEMRKIVVEGVQKKWPQPPIK